MRTHNKKFKADKPVNPVCGLTHCYVDARTGALGEKSKMKKVLVFLIFCISTLLLSCVTNSPVKKDLFNNLKSSILKIQTVTL